MEAPGRVKPPRPGGLTRSRSRRRGTLLLVGALFPLPLRAGRVTLVPDGEGLVLGPVKGVGPVAGTMPGVTVLLTTSTGISRIRFSSLRSHGGQRSVTSKVFSP